MQRILIALVITFLAKISVADEISVNEFVSGTTISSSDMNQNFQTLVDESNENDERIKGLENAAAAVSPVPTWIDGQGSEIGRWNGQNNPWGIIPILEDTDLVFPPFATVSGNGISYPDNGRLWYNSSRCDTPPRAQYPTSDDWGSGTELFITAGGFFAYASSIKGGDSWRASAYSYWTATGLKCVNGLRDLDGWYEVIVTDQLAPIPIELPLSLRWR